MAENSKKNGEETTKKLFVKGGKPGPGRGHKKEKDIQLDGELLDMIEQVVITGLGAKELKDRLKAAGIDIRVQGMRRPKDRVNPLTRIHPSKLGLQNAIQKSFAIDIYRIVGDTSGFRIAKKAVL